MDGTDSMCDTLECAVSVIKGASFLVEVGSGVIVSLMKMIWFHITWSVLGDWPGDDHSY